MVISHLEFSDICAFAICHRWLTSQLLGCEQFTARLVKVTTHVESIPSLFLGLTGQSCSQSYGYSRVRIARLVYIATLVQISKLLTVLFQISIAKLSLGMDFCDPKFIGWSP